MAVGRQTPAARKPHLPIVDGPSLPQRHPTVAALEHLWQEIARRPLWAPPHFFTYLRLRWRMRLRLLDADAVTIGAPAGKINDCSGCNDSCCVGKRATVLLRLRDIATLVDLGRTDLITTAKPTFDPDEIAHRPALARQLASRSWRMFPVLKQNGFGACAALTVQGKCAIYPHWPMSCARFPYALHLDDAEIFYSQRCNSFWIHPRAGARVKAMAAAAVASYNERIKDLVLLAYAPRQLEDLGLLQFISL